jgi:beta-mannosidase
MVSYLSGDGSQSIVNLEVIQWQICSTPPGQISELSQLDESLPWQNVSGLKTVAESLRNLGQWTIDDSSPRFDALDWWYQCEFDLPSLAINKTAILGLDGLASIAEVWLNGEIVLRSTNMFHQHRLDVGSKLHLVGNRLVLGFRSLDHQLKQRRPRPRWRAPMMENQQLRYFRTTVLGRTPGWSPPCPVTGPWRSIWLLQQPKFRLNDLRLQTAVIGDTGIVNISFQLNRLPTPFSEVAGVELLVTRESLQYSALFNFDVESSRYSCRLPIEQVQRWWPHTHGRPDLYAAELRITCKPGDPIVVHDLGNIGFRNIEIKRQQGSFTVCVNGVEIFCRGGSWMPLNPVTLNASEAEYSYALNQLRAAGMNMLRVSGTSSYETDVFFRLCDQLGIMIWQEFMFAGMDYPEDEEFISSVSLEARQQLCLWQSHPSLTVVCGNAEVEQQAAMWGADRSLWTPRLFYTVLTELTKEWCPNAFYWPSATHEGAFPHQCDTGTAFYYGFGAYLLPQSDTRLSRVRFATECLAISNIPELGTLKLLPGAKQNLPKVHHPVWKIRSPRDLGSSGWDFDDVRDYYLGYYFKVDPLQLRYADHDCYLHLSKIVSGEMMAAAFNEWRSGFSVCNGALIWFLRDLWPGAGWGIIDSEGRPKSCYYYLKRVLQPISVSLSDEASNGYYVHISNETAQAQTVTIDVLAYKDGYQVVASGSRSIELGERNNDVLSLSLWFDHFVDLNHSYRFGQAIADSIYVCLKSSDGTKLADTYAFPSGLANLQKSDLGLQATAKLLDDGNAQIHISCQRLAMAIHIDVDDYIPDDNYFHLAPGQNKTVTLTKPQGAAKSLYATVSALNALGSVALSITV